MTTSEIHSAPEMFSAEQLAVDPILQFFHYKHLPPQLQASSAPFCDLANRIVSTLPRNPERTVALRKLLEAKDAAVRANVPAPVDPRQGNLFDRQREVDDAEILDEGRTTARHIQGEDDGPIPFEGDEPRTISRAKMTARSRLRATSPRPIAGRDWTSTTR